MALKGINTPSLYIDQEDTEKEQQSQIFQVYYHITGLGNLTDLHHRSARPRIRAQGDLHGGGAKP